MLDKFAQELKKAREESGLTLQQIASKTRIDVKFLESIEKGNFSFLPDLYLKAFIKEYAAMVGMDPETAIQKFEAAKKGVDIDEQKEITSEEQHPETFEKAQASQPEEKPKEQKPVQKPTYNSVEPPPSSQQDSTIKIDKKVVVIGGIVLGVIAIFLVVYFVFLKSSSEIIVNEKPIDQVIQESKQRYTAEEPGSSSQSNNAASSDSLSLIVSASDTSWVKILIDNQNVEEFTFLPGSKKEIKAQNNIQMDIGSAGALSFNLDNKPLKFSGKKHEVKYISIDSNGLKYMDNPPNFPNK
jgi:cytoskeletal protein RodZ